MLKLTLELEHTYALIGIHSSEEDYRLAFLLNKNLKTSFSKQIEPLSFKDKQACFSVFLYKNKHTCTSEFLIANKHVGIAQQSIETNLYGNSFSETNYLIPEKKNIDFFLKIEGDVSHTYIEEIVKKMNKIKQVLICYTLTPLLLKSKDALIF